MTLNHLVESSNLSRLTITHTRTRPSPSPGGPRDSGTEPRLGRSGPADAPRIVLLVEQGDAPSGRRTEIRDARDRYANLDTSYLLPEGLLDGLC